MLFLYLNLNLCSLSMNKEYELKTMRSFVVCSDKKLEKTGWKQTKDQWVDSPNPYKYLNSQNISLTQYFARGNLNNNCLK